MTTETIRCPACGEKILQDVENCPVCGAPISVIMNNDISGAPIDNSAAIDAMLRSASQFMEESESLGLDELGIFDDEEEEEEEKEEVFKKVTLKELPPELSEDQKDEIEAGGVINLTPEAEPVPAPSPAPPPAPPKGRSKQKSSSGGSDGFKELTPKNAAPVSAAATAAPSRAPAAKGEVAPEIAAENKKKEKGQKAQNEEPMLFEVDENGNPVKKKKQKKVKKKKEKAERPEKTKREKTKSSPLGAVIAAFIALAVGLCGGYFGKMFLFPDLPTPECQSFAQNAVNAAVKEIAGAKELYIAEAYVKDGAFSAQCIFRALTQSESDVSSEWFRVKIDHDTAKTTVYFELRPEEYERLRNSENSEDRAKAAVLKSSQNELDRCISEMKAGDGWSSANISLINNALHPYAEVTKAPKETPETSEEASE